MFTQAEERLMNMTRKPFPVAVFGEKIMYMTSKNTSKSGAEADAKFHDRIMLGLRMKSDESIIGRPNWGDQSKDCEEAPRGSKIVR